MIQVEETPTEELTERQKLLKELEEIEQHAKRRRELSAKARNERCQTLLSYEEGFDWSPDCKNVSKVTPISELREVNLRGCQRPACRNCYQWKGKKAPYQSEDFFYEGEKEGKPCAWYSSGKGCPYGNKCDQKHLFWDESLPENKRRCYACGARGHTSLVCSRPGGRYEGCEDEDPLDDRSVKLPKRPTGEKVVLPKEGDKDHPHKRKI